jgi:protease YdgD
VAEIQSRIRFALAMACLSVVVAYVRALPESPSALGDTRTVDELNPPWGAVGQINVAGYRRRTECTGSLIAANVVITAAHCVMDPWHRKPFPVDEIHFLAGVRRSKWLGHSTAKCLHFPPDYEYRDHPSSNDVVLIMLNDSFHNIAPSELDRAGAQGSDISLVYSLVYAAYLADRRYVLSAQFGCHLLAQDHGLWLTDCYARPAGSGGPVFVQRNDGLKLAAIMVGTAPSRSVAIPIPNWVDLPAARKCP